MAQIHKDVEAPNIQLFQFRSLYSFVDLGL